MTAQKFNKYYAAQGFNPELFEWVTWFDSDGPEVVIDYVIVEVGTFASYERPYIVTDENGEPVRSHKGKCLDLLAEEGYGKFVGKCQHCGAHLRYCCIFRNTENGELIVVGETCAEERMGLTLDQFVINRGKEASKAAETRAWRAEQKSKWLDADSTREELMNWLGEQPYNEFYNSLLNRFNNYGELTEAQEKAAWKSKAREEQWEQQKAEEAANAVDAPQGRRQVTGTILSKKWVDSQFGATEKMIVKADEGYRFYCTVPSSLYEYQEEDGSITPRAEVGDKISLLITLTPSDNDATFAWGKRPSKAEIIERA